ncbi:MAG: hypothetical protein QXL51_06210 [Candidatus Aenigmatarchaeota archaeon]
MSGFEKEIMKGWREYTLVLKKQLRCEHKDVLWDVTGKVGICLDCGITIKKGEIKK